MIGLKMTWRCLSVGRFCFPTPKCLRPPLLESYLLCSPKAIFCVHQRQWEPLYPMHVILSYIHLSRAHASVCGILEPARRGTYIRPLILKFINMLRIRRIVMIYVSPRIRSSFISDAAWYPGKRCEICGQQFFAPSSFRNHRALHRGETKCPICLRVFSHKGNMKSHLKKMHASDL